jgi:hypothetical protein
VISNGGSSRVPQALAWAVFDMLPPPIKLVVRECGINIDPLEVMNRVQELQRAAKTEREIALWLETVLKALTHQKYKAAGHPQLSPPAPAASVGPRIDRERLK